MNFVEAIKTCLVQKYCDFSGRARRSEYWYFALFNSIISWLVSLIFKNTNVVSIIVSLALLLPGLGVCVRRLHDLNKSGWKLLLALIPLVGAIILIVWFCKEGTAGPNQYGPDPKGRLGNAQTASYAPSYNNYQAPAQSNPYSTYQTPAQQDYSNYRPFQSEPQAPAQPDYSHYQAPAQPAAPTRKFCSNCGQQVDADSAFCTNCGSPLK